MNNEIWLPIEDVCTLTGEIKETVRRKCKSEVYVSKFTKNGKFKNYSVLLSSLSPKAQNKYFHIEEKKNLSIKEINENSVRH
jgi:hypothetical protein